MDLIDRILTGDSQAVIEFYKTYSPKILRYAQKKVPTLSDAEELTNDVFLEAIDKLSLFEKRSSVQTWLYNIAHNKIVDYYRKRKIKSVLFSQFPVLNFLAQEITEPEFVYEKNKFRDNLESTLLRLSEKYRKILQMHYEEGLSIKEIAILLNLTPKATESLLFRARKDFQKKYARE